MKTIAFLLAVYASAGYTVVGTVEGIINAHANSVQEAGK